MTTTAEDTALAAIDTVAAECSLAINDAHGRIARSIAVAEGMKTLKEALRPYIQKLMPLQGSPLGFVTDRDKTGGYEEETVLTCCTEALILGVYPVNNEFNIIAGRCYVTKNGMAHKVREVPDLTDLRYDLGVPRTLSGGAVVPCKARWMLNGTAQQMECEIPVRVNAGMGADAILGKAVRKLLARIYGQVTAAVFTVPDGEVDGDFIDVDASPMDTEIAPRSGVEAAKAKIRKSKPQEAAPSDAPGPDGPATPATDDDAPETTETPSADELDSRIPFDRKRAIEDIMLRKLTIKDGPKLLKTFGIPAWSVEALDTLPDAELAELMKRIT